MRKKAANQSRKPRDGQARAFPENKAKARKALTAREKRFVGEYLIDLDPERAAVAAGYSRTVARTKAYQWVSRSQHKPHVFAAVHKAMEKRAAKLNMSAERVLKELALVAFSNMADYIGHKKGDVYVDLSNLTREQATAIQEITVDEYTGGRGKRGRQVKRTRFKLADQLRALELLGKHLELWVERRKIEPSRELVELIQEGRKRVVEWKSNRQKGK